MNDTTAASPVFLQPEHVAGRSQLNRVTQGKPITQVTYTPAGITTCDLSIVVPTFNEEERLPATLERIDAYRGAKGLSAELLIVDDGSRDATRRVAYEFARGKKWVRIVHYHDENDQPVNRGKGFAVRQGMLASVGRDVLFSDADLSTPIEEMEKLLPLIARGECDLAIASRALPESDLTVHQPLYREMMGRTFNRFVRSVIRTDIHDTQCGFKAFRGDVARHLFSLAQVDGFGFDTEIVYLADKFGYRVREIGVVWQHKEASRVNPLLAPLTMMRELLEIRLNDVRGVYNAGVGKPNKIAGD